MINNIFNEDCKLTMERMVNNNFKVDLVLTSPPYNTSRKRSASKKLMYSRRYLDFDDFKNDDDYLKWTLDIFNYYERVLVGNGVILYNLSYSSEKPYLMWLLLSEIINKTDFTIADTIVWKKKSALPNNRSHNKLTRIVEYIFVICRKKEIQSFKTNKKVVSTIESTGQKNYENIYNYIEARNNDGPNLLNKATYSSELCEKLLDIYGIPNSIVYDSFLGTGTTAVSCIRKGLNFVGSEISKEQCIFAEERIKNELENN